MLFGADDWDVPLPTDMEALIEGLLQENDLAQGSVFCSAAFQADLQVFLQIQVAVHAPGGDVHNVVARYPSPDHIAALALVQFIANTSMHEFFYMFFQFTQKVQCRRCTFEMVKLVSAMTGPW